MKEVIASYQPDLDAIDWRTSFRRIRSAILGHIPLIVTSVIVALVLMFLYVKIFPPVFKAEVVLMAEAPDDVIRGNYYENWNVFRKWDIKSEPEFITSARVGKPVVEALNLKFGDVYHTFLTHLGSLWVDSYVGKKYRAFKEWVFPPDPGAYRPTDAEIERARTLDAFKDGVTVEVTPGTTVARITVRAPSHRAGEIANKLVETYMLERTRMMRTEADEAFKSLSVEVDNTRTELERLDKERMDFETKNQVVLGFEKDRLEVANWSALQNSIKDLSSLIAGYEASLALIEQQIRNEKPEIISARTWQDSKSKALLEAREVDLKNTLFNNSQRYAPTSPEVTDVEKMLKDTRQRLQSEPERVVADESRIMNPVYTALRQEQNTLSISLAAARAKLAAKQAPLAALELRMSKVPELTITSMAQTRARDSIEMRYKILAQRMMQAEVSRAAIGSAPPSVRVVDFASAPMKPIWPRNIILIPSTIAAGLVIGCLLALLAEVFSPRVNRDRLISHRDVPVYAVIDLRPMDVPALAGPGGSSAIERLRRHA